VSTSPALPKSQYRAVGHYKALVASPHAAVACTWNEFEEVWNALLVATGAVGKGDTDFGTATRPLSLAPKWVALQQDQHEFMNLVDAGRV
jgi:hypothetical protein